MYVYDIHTKRPAYCTRYIQRGSLLYNIHTKMFICVDTQMNMQKENYLIYGWKERKKAMYFISTQIYGSCLILATGFVDCNTHCNRLQQTAAHTERHHTRLRCIVATLLVECNTHCNRLQHALQQTAIDCNAH